MPSHCGHFHCFFSPRGIVNLLFLGTEPFLFWIDTYFVALQRFYGPCFHR